MSASADLFTWAKERRFDGGTFSQPRDGARLSGQLQRVWEVMRDGEWRTLDDLAALANGSPAAVSARLRDLRKPRFGGHTVKRKYLGNGLWAYQLTPKHPTA